MQFSFEACNHLVLWCRVERNWQLLRSLKLLESLKNWNDVVLSRFITLIHSDLTFDLSKPSSYFVISLKCKEFREFSESIKVVSPCCCIFCYEGKHGTTVSQNLRQALILLAVLFLYTVYTKTATGGNCIKSPKTIILQWS